MQARLVFLRIASMFKVAYISNFNQRWSNILNRSRLDTVQSQAPQWARPLTTSRGVDKLVEHVSDAISLGAHLLCGGKRLDHIGAANFFEPTVIENMNHFMLTSREEFFGPLLGLFKFETEDEAVHMANDTTMGLAAYFFTNDTSRTWGLLEALKAGMIAMNTGEQLQ